MKLLIDVTEERFKIAANAAVIDYIARENPFTHPDVGRKLINLGKLLPGAHHYCPDFASAAYVVLHTGHNLIFAIGLGMKQIAFRLPPAVTSEALADGTAERSQIGPDWICCAPFGSRAEAALVAARHQRWAEAACRYAQELAGA